MFESQTLTTHSPSW